MAGTPQFIDISMFQSLPIDWNAYRAWAAQWDGIARVSMRSSYGTGYTDQHFAAYRKGALNAGIDVIIFYHYAYPELNSATAEADWQRQVVGEIRSNDILMLDYEENSPQATAEWAYEWLCRQEQNYRGKLPTIYASDSYIRTRLQDARLARFPLTLANWQYTPTERPACPPPWQMYSYLQYTDRATNIPGVPGAVDANIFLGGETIPVPTTTSGGENAVFIDDISQLEAGETEDACVAFSAANVFYATQPGTPNHHTAEEVDQLADKWYSRLTGSISNSDGLSEAQLHTMLDGLGLRYEPIPISNKSANDEAVRTALRAGKLVIICAAESSFFDLEIGRPPYSWNTKPFNHCIVASGLITSGPWQGNVWVRDTVAISGGYLPSTRRPYDLGKMQYVSLTAVIPPWLKGGSMNVPTGWTDDGAVLTAPNGHKVVRGFRLGVLNHPDWDPGNQPNEEEYATPHVLLHNVSVGAGTRQTFRDGEFWWTSAKGVVWEPFVGLELKACYDQIEALQAEITQLKAQPSPQPPQQPNTTAIADLQALRSNIDVAIAKILADLGASA